MSAPAVRRRPFPDPRYLDPRPRNRVATRKSSDRGVAVFLGVPAGDGFPDAKELLGLAEALHELARELVPSATTHTEVTLTRPHTRDQNASGIAIDLAQREVAADAATVDLTRLEFSLLAHLALSDRRVVGREELMTTVWRGHIAGDRTVDVHVRRLRHKLEQHGLVLTTVRGVGYRLESSVTVTGRPTESRPIRTEASWTGRR